MNEEPQEDGGAKEPSPSAPQPTDPGREAEESVVDAEEVAEDVNEESVGGDDGDEEVRQRLEEEIKKVAVEDVILQSTVSILNLAARRIAKDDERDLAQGKIGIDAAKALLEYLPEEASERVREAVSELQMLYAKRASEAT